VKISHSAVGANKSKVTAPTPPLVVIVILGISVPAITVMLLAEAVIVNSSANATLPKLSAMSSASAIKSAFSNFFTFLPP
jgi:hypothetical protein